MFTVKQVADRLGVSPGLVYSLCAAGRLRHERHGLGRGTIRVPADALDEYRAGRTVAAVGTRPAAPAAAPRPIFLKHLSLE